MINLVNILKYCPEGLKLYSPLFGEVTFKEISNSNNILCKVTKCGGNITTTSFTRLGRYYCEFPSAECVLFPSKDQRDWSKFRIPVKKGDIMMRIDGTAPFIATGELDSDNSPKYVCGINSAGKFQLSNSGNGWTMKFYIPASEDVKEKLFKAIDDAGYTWDGKTLKKKTQFKPFEKVLTRDDKEDKWRCTFYSHFEPNSIYHHTTVSGIYAMCIPFEGNEHLVGTTNNP